jgi:hypothetical protein
MEYYIAQAKIVLPVLGINIFRSAQPADSESPGRADPASQRQLSPVFELHLKKEGLLAKAQEIDGEFTVLAGSQSRTQWTATITTSDDGITMHFTRAQVFGSPSAAGAVILGRAVNGRTDWRIPGSNVNYGSWQNQGVETTAFSTADTDENAFG